MDSNLGRNGHVLFGGRSVDSTKTDLSLSSYVCTTVRRYLSLQSHGCCVDNTETGTSSSPSSSSYVYTPVRRYFSPERVVRWAYSPVMGMGVPGPQGRMVPGFKGPRVPRVRVHEFRGLGKKGPKVHGPRCLRAQRFRGVGVQGSRGRVHGPNSLGVLRVREESKGPRVQGSKGPRGPGSTGLGV